MKNDVKKMYCEENKSQSEIAKELNISQPYVSKLMNKHNIKTRKQSEALKNRNDDWIDNMKSEGWKRKISETKQRKPKSGGES